MEQNIKCTIEEVINMLKEKYKSEGENALYADNDWHIYVADDELFLGSICCITAPPDFDEETDEEIIQKIFSFVDSLLVDTRNYSNILFLLTYLS